LILIHPPLSINSSFCFYLLLVYGSSLGFLGCSGLDVFSDPNPFGGYQCILFFFFHGWWQRFEVPSWACYVWQCGTLRSYWEGMQFLVSCGSRSPSLLLLFGLVDLRISYLSDLVLSVSWDFFGFHIRGSCYRISSLGVFSGPIGSLALFCCWMGSSPAWLPYVLDMVIISSLTQSFQSLGPVWIFSIGIFYFD